MLPMPEPDRPLTGHRAVAGGLRAALVLLLLLATVWQSCLLGAHHHFRLPPVAAAGLDQAIGKAPAPSHDAPLPADNCPLCQEAAHGGTYLPPAPVAIAPPAPGIIWYTDTAAPQIVDRQRSHGWRSRAPPASLHA